jgi:hypothetical protein
MQPGYIISHLACEKAKKISKHKLSFYYLITKNNKNQIYFYYVIKKDA